MNGGEDVKKLNDAIIGGLFGFVVNLMRKRDGFEIFFAILKKTLHKSKIRVQC